MLTLIPLADFTPLHKLNDVLLHTWSVEYTLHSLYTCHLARMTFNRGLMQCLDYLLLDSLTVPYIQPPFILGYSLAESKVRILWRKIQQQLAQRVLALFIFKVAVL